MRVLVASPACPAHFGGRRTRNRRSAGHCPGRPCRWRACGCTTASGAPTPVRAPWTWLGVTPISGKPRLAPRGMEPDSPIPPAAAGSLPANSPSRKGVERRFEALEDPLPDHLAVGLSGIGGQDRDAPVPARRLAFPHGIDGPGATPSEVGMAVHIPTVAVPYQAPRRVGRSRQRPQAPARHGRHGALAANAMKSATCGIGGVSHPSVITVHNDPNVTCALWIGNGSVENRLRIMASRSKVGKVRDGGRPHRHGDDSRQDKPHIWRTRLLSATFPPRRSCGPSPRGIE